MATNYPGALDAYTKPVAGPRSAEPDELQVAQDLTDAVNAIEGELGVDPAGADATVVARLDRIDGELDAKLDSSSAGTMAAQDADSVAITGGTISGITDLAVADGGTGASDAAGARANLGLGSAAVLDTGTADDELPVVSHVSSLINAAVVGEPDNANIIAVADADPVSDAGLVVLTAADAAAQRTALLLGGSVSVLDHGASADGVTDDTAAFAAAIAAANGAVPVYVPAGTYKVGTSASVVLDVDGTTLVGDGESSVLSCSTNRAVIEITGDNVTVEAVKVSATGAGGSQHGVYAHDCTAPSVRNVTVNGPGYDGILYLASVSHGIVAGCRVSSCGDDGINIGGDSANPVTDCTVVGNVVTSVTNDGIHISDGSTRTTVTGNVIDSCGNGVGLYRASNATVTANVIKSPTNYGIHVPSGPSTDITIADNVIVGGSRAISMGLASLRYRVAGNIITSPTTYGIVISNGTTIQTDAAITGNMIYGGCSTCAILVSGAHDVQVADNTITDVDGAGIQLASSLLAGSRITIAGNHVSSTGIGINQTSPASAAQHIKIIDNVVQSSGRGIYYSGGEYFVIERNTVLGASDYAIALSAGSAINAYGVVADNVIVGGCTGAGINVFQFSDVSIRGNVVKGITASNGVAVSSASRVVIQHNQATVSGGASGLGVGAAPSATTPGTVAAKVAVYKPDGSLAGYVPVYDAIT